MLITSQNITRQLFNCIKQKLFMKKQPTLFICRNFGQPIALTHPHLLTDGDVTPGLTKAEYLSRRTKLVNKAVSTFKQVKNVENHIIIIPSASKVFMSNDIPYQFRQNTDFLYFCGFQEPDSVLVLESGKTSSSTGDHISSLFVPEKNQHKELWDGPRSGKQGALELTGVDMTHSIEDFESFLKNFHKRNSGFVLWYNYIHPVNQMIHAKIFGELMIETKHRSMEDTTRLCHQLRLVKSPAEIQLMKRSVEIASLAFREVMKFSFPEINESVFHAKMDYECRMMEAEYLAYPPVVAGGQRANIIHYINNNQLIKGGDLVLMDAGCEYHGYTSDITRTWPVSGKFSPAQKQVYNAVLTVQLACIQLCTVHITLDQIYHTMLTLIGLQLQQLSLINTQLKSTDLMQAAKEFCPHHVSHYLGMDVHDTGEISRSINLQAGMIVTVEPGIYINDTNMMVPEEFRGIGIRIEDDVLITEDKPVVLSAYCPKTVEEIESLMASKDSSTRC